MKKIHTAVTLIIIFFMVVALYICGRYENAPDRIFTGKVSAPEGEWTIDASDGVTKAEVTFSLSDRGEHEEWVLLLRSQERKKRWIGGDEFVIILKNKTAEETEEIIRQVRAEIEFADEQSDIPISVAMGYVWTDAEEKNLQELIHCADEKIYQDKKQIKENTPSV